MAFRGADECSGWREMISRGADGELSVADEAGLRAHLARCAGCAAESRVDRELRLALRRDPLPLTEVRLPSGEELARSVREAEALSVKQLGRRSWSWAGALAATAAVIAIIGSQLPDPQPRAVQSPPPATAQPTPGFWIVDDERTGRDVIVGPSVSFAGTQ